MANILDLFNWFSYQMHWWRYSMRRPPLKSPMKCCLLLQLIFVDRPVLYRISNLAQCKQHIAQPTKREKKKMIHQCGITFWTAYEWLWWWWGYSKLTCRQIEAITRHNSNARISWASFVKRYFNCDAFTANNAKSSITCVIDFFDA